VLRIRILTYRLPTRPAPIARSFKISNVIPETSLGRATIYRLIAAAAFHPRSDSARSEPRGRMERFRAEGSIKRRTLNNNLAGALIGAFCYKGLDPR
jgi:hypothetical protein